MCRNKYEQSIINCFIDIIRSKEINESGCISSKTRGVAGVISRVFKAGIAYGRGSNSHLVHVHPVNPFQILIGLKRGRPISRGGGQV